MKQVKVQSPDLVSLSVRVPRATADALKVIADAEYRPVAAHIRRLIEQEIARSADPTPVPDLKTAA
jgi:predicted DNA-binding protein